ncbi:hypothetical protein SEA_MORKIE_26 [Gordonia phage Morkie]|nr:hypothetical protein SEA_MORKIE_26 [Gordonia phage Morkie]
MPTITFTIDGPPGNAGYVRFVPRGEFTTPDGDLVTETPSMRRIAYQTNVPSTVQLPPGPWGVAGLAGGNPLPIDVGTVDADLKDLIVFGIPAGAPVTTLAQAVTAWMDSNVNTEVSDSLIAGAVSTPGSEAKTALDAAYAPLDLVADGITYNPDGTVASSTEGGITTTYTWNIDGTCHTETRLGKVKTWTYDSAGNPISSTVTEA